MYSPDLEQCMYADSWSEKVVYVAKYIWIYNSAISSLEFVELWPMIRK